MSENDRLVAAARKQKAERQRGYRARALKLFPWVCGICGREFGPDNVQQLTVHHKDFNHDHNPPDGSNWELLCIYCHDNEHARDAVSAAVKPVSATEPAQSQPSRYLPFADLDKK